MCLHKYTTKENIVINNTIAMLGGKCKTYRKTNALDNYDMITVEMKN